MPIPSLPLAVVEVDKDRKAVGSVANSIGSAVPHLLLASHLKSHRSFGKLHNVSMLRFPHLSKNNCENS